VTTRWTEIGFGSKACWNNCIGNGFNALFTGHRVTIPSFIDAPIMSSDLIANGGNVCLWRADGMKRQQFDHHRNSKPSSWNTEPFERREESTNKQMHFTSLFAHLSFIKSLCAIWWNAPQQNYTDKDRLLFTVFRDGYVDMCRIDGSRLNVHWVAGTIQRKREMIGVNTWIYTFVICFKGLFFQKTKLLSLFNQILLSWIMKYCTDWFPKFTVYIKQLAKKVSRSNSSATTWQWM